MLIKRNIIFSLENRKKDNKQIIENVPIRMRLIYNGKRIDFSTGYRIDLAKWDVEKQRVKNGCTNKLKQTSSDINADLLKYFTDLQTTFKEFEIKNILPDPAQIKKGFALKNKKQNIEGAGETFSFFIALDEFTRENGRQNDWTASTFEKFHAVKNHLIDFNPILAFDDLDEKGLQIMLYFFKSTKACATVQSANNLVS